jgi:hypothetical protein
MAADGSTGRPATDQVAHIFTAFVHEVFRPIVGLSGVPSQERRRLLDDIRQRLDVAEQVLATEEAAAGTSAYATPLPPAQAAVGAADAEADGSALDEIGRNQRSRVRELVLLDALSRETKAYSLQQLMAALAQRGFQDTQSAVVSQLHRLKKLGLIRQPENSTGMYEVTDAGLGHARSLRASFGAYLPA